MKWSECTIHFQVAEDQPRPEFSLLSLLAMSESLNLLILIEKDGVLHVSKYVTKVKFLKLDTEFDDDGILIDFKFVGRPPFPFLFKRDRFSLVFNSWLTSTEFADGDISDEIADLTLLSNPDEWSQEKVS